MASLYRTLLILIAASLIAGCATDNYPDHVEASLRAAGINRTQLEHVIDHYKASGDTLRLQAAYFLIGNMAEHCYVTYRWIDTTKTTVDLDPLIYPDFASLLTAVDSIEQERGELDYEKLDKIMDVETITSDFLIANIDLAFRVWKDKPWAEFLSFDDFCRYVLPYRGSNEPIEDWRSYFLEKYADIGSQVSDDTNPVEVASAINKDVQSWFGFDERYYFHPTDQGLAEMIEAKLGRCEDMTNMAIFALRANGIAVTSDYTPHWANTGNNHAWNAILDADGEVIPFMGAEANPGEYKLFNKAAKVYRKTFDQQLDNLAFQQRKQDKIPGWLAGKSYIDVTTDYMDVTDVEIDLNYPVPDSIDIAYICVFNSGQFRPIHWGFIENGNVLFTEMGTGILYIAALYENEEVVPITPPFILGDDGIVTYLTAETHKTTSVTIDNVPIRAMAASSETVEKAPLDKNASYELFFWADGDWISQEKYPSGNNTIKAANLPSGGLYWLVKVDSSKDERVFTIENGKQIFW